MFLRRVLELEVGADDDYVAVAKAEFDVAAPFAAEAESERRRVFEQHKARAAAGGCRILCGLKAGVWLAAVYQFAADRKSVV